MVPGEKRTTVTGRMNREVTREVRVRSDQVKSVSHRRSSFMGGGTVGNAEEETGSRILMTDSGEVQIVGSLDAVNMAEDMMVAIFGKSEKKPKGWTKSKLKQQTGLTRIQTAPNLRQDQDYMAGKLYLADTPTARYYLTAKKESSSEMKRGGKPALGLLKDKTGTSSVVGENCLPKVSRSLEVGEQAKDEEVTMSGKAEYGPKAVRRSKALKRNNQRETTTSRTRAPSNSS